MCVSWIIEDLEDRGRGEEEEVVVVGGGRGAEPKGITRGATGAGTVSAGVTSDERKASNEYGFSFFLPAMHWRWLRREGPRRSSTNE